MKRPLDIYRPSEDTFLLIDSISDQASRGHVLAVDVGCGSGSVAEALLGVSDEVIAVDVALPALEATKERLRRELRRVHLIASDGVRFLRAGAPADLIACNPPYLPIEPGEEYDPAVHGGPRGVEFSEELLSSLAERLKGKAWALFLIASSLSDLGSLVRHAERLGLEVTFVARRRIFFEEIYCLKVEPHG
ncbi:MAG: methyltransferase domain-containing protein [Candidatus Caldarchaeales archaeon]